MKYLIILGDGMADEPLDCLSGFTPLQAANTPNIDALALKGKCGLLKTVPDGFHPGSEVANLSVLGYDLPSVFEGRGVLEAASLGVEINEGELAMRCNLICIEDGLIKNHSAGHISNEEASVLIAFLQEKLGGAGINFFPGVSYRHLLKIEGGNKKVRFTPPHDVPGTAFSKVLPTAEVVEGLEAEQTAALLRDLILRSQILLADHPINLRRKEEGKDPANSIWPWSAGYRPKMETLANKYAVTNGSVISAVDLIQGIGKYAGLEPIIVEGATGLYNTNYEGKVSAALSELRKKDFVFLHLEASDEAGHEGDVALKIRTIEDLDNRVVKPIMDEILTWNEDISVALLPDHPTPCAIRTHTSEPVPFVIFRANEEGDSVSVYNEVSAADGVYGLIEGDQFMNLFISI